jgi:DNA/RNA endonuclease YhcR with UshA esterase domain
MNKKILFIIVLLEILTLLILTQTIKGIRKEGVIEKIDYSSNKITLTITNLSKELIIFENKRIKLKEGDQIVLWGKEETYKNKEQIIVEKIIKKNPLSEPNTSRVP